MGFGKNFFIKSINLDARQIFQTQFWHPRATLKIAITPKLFGRQPSNFTTILPLSSSNKKVVGRVRLKWIVTEILIKIMVFVRKLLSYWFFEVDLSKKKFFFEFFFAKMAS